MISDPVITGDPEIPGTGHRGLINTLFGCSFNQGGSKVGDSHICHSHAGKYTTVGFGQWRRHPILMALENLMLKTVKRQVPLLILTLLLPILSHAEDYLASEGAAACPGKVKEYRVTTLSDSGSAQLMSWLEITTDAPDPVRLLTILERSLQWGISRLAVGSSSSRILGP